MKYLKYLLSIIAGILLTTGIVYAINVTVPQSTVKGNIPVGNANGTYNNGFLVAGTNVTISTSTVGQIMISATGGSGGAGNVSTSSNEVSGRVAYWTSNSGTPALLGQVATGTVSNGTGISVTANQSIIGSGLTITNTSPLSGLTATFPFLFSNPTLTWLGLSTSTPGITSGQPIYATGVNTIASVASSTFLTNIGGQASGNYITALTGDITASGPGSSAATLATVNGNVGVFTNANITVNAKGLVTAAANGTAGLTSYDAWTHSSIFLPNSATTSKISIGTTTPYYSFTIASSTGAQVALSDGISGDAQVTLRNAGGNLYIATTTVAGTSTTTSAALSIIGSSGFIGIGTSTPTASLDIFAGSQSAPYLAIGSTTAQIATIGPSATTLVGIGTTTPWKTLSLVGTMAVNGLTVATGKNSVCIDATTKEILDSGSTTCSLSSVFTKDIVGKITPEVAKYIVDRMNAISFNYKGETEQHYGFIAEEAAKIDTDVKAKFGIDAHLAEYANTDVNMLLSDGTYHFFKKGDPINFQYPNYTAILTVYLQGQQTSFDQKINDQNKLIQNLIDAVKLVAQFKK